MILRDNLSQSEAKELVLLLPNHNNLTQGTCKPETELRETNLEIKKHWIISNNNLVQPCRYLKPTELTKKASRIQMAVTTPADKLVIEANPTREITWWFQATLKHNEQSLNIII